MAVRSVLVLVDLKSITDPDLSLSSCDSLENLDPLSTFLYIWNAFDAIGSVNASKTIFFFGIKFGSESRNQVPNSSIHFSFPWFQLPASL